ncbi:ABC transporter permease, partial [Rhizobium johnstonii]
MAHITLEAGLATMFRPGTADTESEAAALKTRRRRKTLVR